MNSCRAFNEGDIDFISNWLCDSDRMVTNAVVIDIYAAASQSESA